MVLLVLRSVVQRSGAGLAAVRRFVCCMCCLFLLALFLPLCFALYVPLLCHVCVVVCALPLCLPLVLPFVTSRIACVCWFCVRPVVHVQSVCVCVCVQQHDQTVNITDNRLCCCAKTAHSTEPTRRDEREQV